VFRFARAEAFDLPFELTARPATTFGLSQEVQLVLLGKSQDDAQVANPEVTIMSNFRMSASEQINGKSAPQRGGGDLVRFGELTTRVALAPAGVKA
jgi:hypothetical protein